MPVKKILIFVGIGVIVLLVALAGVLLYRGYIQFSRTKGTLRSSKVSLDSYYAKNPFPSAANLKVESQNGAVLNEWMKRLLDELHEGQIEPTQITPATFMTRFNRGQNELMALATQSGTVCPATFAFAFERYATAGKLPAPPDVPRLTQQLAIIEELCKVLFTAGIAELVSIQRDVFEAAEADGEGRSTGRTAGRRRPAGGVRGDPAQAGEGDGGADAGLFEKDALYAKFHFTMEFKAKESAVLPVLNSLAAHDAFIVVTSVSFARKTPDVLEPKGEQVAMVRRTGMDAPLEADRDGVVKPPTEPPARAERVISGLERETPTQVILDVDVYNFAKSE